MSDTCKQILGAMFTQQRLKIMSLGVHHKAFDDAYLYAWYAGVYPIDCTINFAPHEYYNELFKISQKTMIALDIYLDKCKQNNMAPTFTQLEAHYNENYDRDYPSQSGLISACRYFYMKKKWDNSFWKKLLSSWEKTAATQVVKKFSRANDIKFE